MCVWVRCVCVTRGDDVCASGYDVCASGEVCVRLGDFSPFIEAP